MLIRIGKTSPSAPECHLLNGKELEEDTMLETTSSPYFYMIMSIWCSYWSLITFILHSYDRWVFKKNFLKQLPWPVSLKTEPSGKKWICHVLGGPSIVGRALIITTLIGRIWFLDFRLWGETTQRPELMSQLVQSLTPTKGQKPQAGISTKCLAF